MPIVIPKDLPAYGEMQRENVFVMNEIRAQGQDIRPIEIAILNLMPTKIATETQLCRLLSNSPLQVHVTFLGTASYESKNVSPEHLRRFYTTFPEVSDRFFDGMIVTGAPVETLEFEEVAYWKELTEVFEFARKNVTSTMFICWGAQAALYYYYGIEKEILPKKIFGVFEHRPTTEFEPLLKGFDDVFFVPHSRRTTVPEEKIGAVSDLEILARSPSAGASIIRSKDKSRVFITGHMEYDRTTLRDEFERDRAKGIPIDPPENYFAEDGSIAMKWSGAANLLFSNWLNYYVYQVTPYERKG